MKERLKGIADGVQWVWKELHRTDLGDSEHYPNGFRKFSCMEPVQYVRLATAGICLAVSLITLYVSK